ncbi:hypothetical protein [Bernardetia sp. MNP-M8]|uniref:hypothetical protein n=1 Tax=Bernardetia sp. MNP-M8 TaxID=3127470 RepID=UPI0030D14609
MFAITYKSYTKNQFYDTKTHVKGILVEKFNLKEIQFIRENKRLAKLGKSHSIPIDYEVVDFFVPLDSLVSYSLSSIISQTDECYGDASYLIDPKDNISSINVFCQEFNYNVESNDKSCRSSFYTLKGDSLFLYKLNYIEGSSIHCNLENTKVNRRFLKFCKPNLDKKYIDCYLFYKIDSVNCELNFDDFSHWE